MGWKISDKPTVDPQDADLFLMEQGGNTRNTTWAKIKSFLLGTETLTTSAQTIKGAINENTASLSDLTKIPGVIDDTGTANTYMITLANAPNAYAKYQTFRFIAKTANTGASTLNVNGLGAKALVKDVNVALATGDILVGQIITAIYDGTNFQIVPDFKAQFANAFSLQGQTASNVDLNTVITQGIYRINGSTCTNTPTTGAITEHSILRVYKQSTVTVQELTTTNITAYGSNANVKYTRVSFDGSTWSAWRQIATTDKPTEIAITTQNGFTTASGSKAKYYKEQDGVVTVNAFFNNTNNVLTNVVMASLPAGYRPNEIVRARGLVTSSNLLKYCEVYINTNGDMWVNAIQDGITTYANVQFDASFVAQQ